MSNYCGEPYTLKGVRTVRGRGDALSSKEEVRSLSYQGLVLRSEFRDGNVPAGFEPVRVRRERLQALPKGIEKVRLRTDPAGYDHKLLQFCAGGHSDFGVIEFALGVDVTAAFKAAVAEVSEWQPLCREVEGRREPAGHEGAEVCFVPSWAAAKKDGPSYRFLAIREPLAPTQFPGMEAAQLPFPTRVFEESRYQVFGLVTKRALPGEELIHWPRERCGTGEEVHAVMKNDLAGGQLPSALCGANAAWWALMVLAFNLNALMTPLVLPEGWASKRLKALRFALIGVAGRVLGRARRLIVRLAEGHPASALLLEVRSRIPWASRRCRRDSGTQPQCAARSGADRTASPKAEYGRRSGVSDYRSRFAPENDAPGPATSCSFEKVSQKTAMTIAVAHGAQKRW